MTIQFIEFTYCNDCFSNQDITRKQTKHPPSWPISKASFTTPSLSNSKIQKFPITKFKASWEISPLVLSSPLHTSFPTNTNWKNTNPKPLQPRSQLSSSLQVHLLNCRHYTTLPSSPKDMWMDNGLTTVISFFYS